MATRWTSILLLALPLIWSCSDHRTDAGSLDSGARLRPDLGVDVTIISVDPPDMSDMSVGRCENLANTDELYCDCNPTCCQRQTWYCPPTGTEIQAKYAILDICDEDLIPCDRSSNSSCPPAEILEESACTHVFDCPPGINEDFTVYYDCEVNGVTGRQEVQCDKGRLRYGECVTCAAEEEICDNVDNDCDGQIDEGQKNVCGGCGQVPVDLCDGLDNDCDGQVDEQLVRECITQCESGLEVCGPGGDWAGCTARRPTEESCDGEDNDCDGLIDEGLNCQCPPELVGALVPCAEEPLTCGMGYKTCECVDQDCVITQMSECLAVCHWFPEIEQSTSCDQYGGTPTSPEVCNNFDEDCDGLIDEGVTRPCYTGPAESLGIGICAPGEQICNAGQWYGQTTSGRYVADACGDEILPSEEICDGADNDCDGVTDYGQEIPETDILFIVDWSGSMENYINAVRMAMNRFAQSFAAEDKLKWGLIVGPKSGGPDYRGMTTEVLLLESDISSLESFLLAFADVGSFDNDTGNEMLKDALMLSVRNITGRMSYNLNSAEWANRVNSVPELSSFKVSWRPGADRIIVVFTDEYDQTFLVPRVDDELLLEALQATPALKVFVFTDSRLSWRDYTNATGGQIFDLSSNQQRMYDDLMSILDEICAGAEN